MHDISIVISTFGSTEWAERGQKLTLKSIDQFGDYAEILHVHGDSLAKARNTGADEATGEYLVFVDADDYLCDGYIEAFDQYIEEDLNVLYKPITMGFKDDALEEPQFVPRTSNIVERNELIIGTGLKKEHFLGFDDSLEALEDWDLWIRMISRGSVIKECPKMCYAINTDISESRNNNKSAQVKAYSEIRRKYGSKNVKVERI